MTVESHSPLYEPTVPEEPTIDGPRDFFLVARSNKQIHKAPLDLILG